MTTTPRLGAKSTSTTPRHRQAVGEFDNKRPWSRTYATASGTSGSAVTRRRRRCATRPTQLPQLRRHGHLGTRTGLTGPQTSKILTTCSGAACHARFGLRRAADQVFRGPAASTTVVLVPVVPP